MENNIDLTTGLPALPKGFNWHVNIWWPSYDRVPTAYVSIQEKVWYGHRTTDSDSVLLGHEDSRDKDLTQRRHPLVPVEPEDYPETVLAAAYEVLKRQEKRFASEAFTERYLEARARLNGNYPPKKLELERSKSDTVNPPPKELEM
jgi:hypothetical protein